MQLHMLIIIIIVIINIIIIIILYLSLMDHTPNASKVWSCWLHSKEKEQKL